METLLNPAVLDKGGFVVAVVVIAIMVIMDKLVWHTRLKKAEDQRDRWEGIALRLMADAQAGVKVTEAAVGIIASLPDPARDKDEVS